MWGLQVSSLLYWAIGSGIIAVPFWKIFSRAGLNPAWAVVVFILFPGFLIALFILAYARWPRGQQLTE